MQGFRHISYIIYPLHTSQWNTEHSPIWFCCLLTFHTIASIVSTLTISLMKHLLKFESRCVHLFSFRKHRFPKSNVMYGCVLVWCLCVFLVCMELCCWSISSDDIWWDSATMRSASQIVSIRNNKSNLSTQLSWFLSFPVWQYDQ